MAPSTYLNSTAESLRRPAIAGRILRPPCLKELEQLFARAILVPFTIAFDDLDEMLRRLHAPVRAGQSRGQIEPGLVIIGI